MSAIGLHNYEGFLLDYSEGNLNAAEVAELSSFLLEHPELEIDLEDFSLVYLNEENHRFEFKQELKKTEEQVPDEELLNYLEGNLSLEETIRLELKLEHDKELSASFEKYKKTILVTDTEITFSSKTSLHKSENDLVVNDRLLAYFENQLTDSEKSEFEKEIRTHVSLQKELDLYTKTVLVADKSILHPDKEALKKEAKIIFFNLRIAGSIAAALLLVVGLAVVYNYYSYKRTESSALSANTSSKKDIDTLTAPTAPTATLRTEVNSGGNKGKNDSSNKKAVFSATKQMFALVEPEEALQTGIEKDVKEIANKEEAVNKETSSEKEDKTEIASILNTEILDSTDKKNYLPLAEDIAYEDELIEVKESSLNGKKGLWRRAVQLAQQANKLGVKSIDGQENSKNNYRLSFNSFSVEKK
ncbi:hypothetical protein CNR22_22000 [Sphingobacteriaceae bacterium]|nr:hypothetical protein CNR22_22000 [Sphingobacteriaceae bacterium]